MKLKEFMNLVDEYIKKYNQKPNRVIILKKDFDELQKDLNEQYDNLTLEKIQFFMLLKVIFRNVDKPILFYEYEDYQLTVGELKEFLKDLPNYYKVYIERIEDVYFDKYGWKTEHFNFGNELENTEGIRASNCAKNEDKIIIIAHI